MLSYTQCCHITSLFTQFTHIHNVVILKSLLTQITHILTHTKKRTENFRNIDAVFRPFLVDTSINRKNIRLIS